MTTFYFVNRGDGSDVCEDCAEKNPDLDLDGPYALDAEVPGFTCGVCRETTELEETQDGDWRDMEKR